MAYLTSAELVAGVARNEQGAIEALYIMWEKPLRYLVVRHLTANDDPLSMVHDIFLAAVQALQRNGGMKFPDALPGYIRMIAHRQIAGRIRELMAERKRGDIPAERDNLDVDGRNKNQFFDWVGDKSVSPETLAIQNEKRRYAENTLKQLNPRQKEILVRFYLKHETQTHICREMHLTETQFRLLKSRAKATFGRIGQASYQHKQTQTKLRLAFFCPRTRGEILQHLASATQQTTN